MNADTARDLLASLGRSTPALPRALCRRNVELFDREDPEGIAEAISLCARCPDRHPCAAWATGQNPRNLFGVIAGHRYVHTIRKR